MLFAFLELVQLLLPRHILSSADASMSAQWYERLCSSINSNNQLAAIAKGNRLGGHLNQKFLTLKHNFLARSSDGKVVYRLRSVFRVFYVTCEHIRSEIKWNQMSLVVVPWERSSIWRNFLRKDDQRRLLSVLIQSNELQQKCSVAEPVASYPEVTQDDLLCYSTFLVDWHFEKIPWRPNPMERSSE